MKFLKKALCVFLSALMLLSALSVSFVSYAADAALNDAYRLLAYQFFNFTDTSTSFGSERTVDRDANGFPVRSIVGDMDQYEVSNSSDDYVYADETGSPIRSVAYDHVVNAKDDLTGNIRMALSQYLKIVDASMSYEYGVGYYTVPLMNAAVKEELKFFKGDDGEYLFLDGYTYLVSSIGNIVGRSKEITYTIENGKIKDLGKTLEDSDWVITGTIGNRRNIAAQIRSAALRAVNLYDYCNVSSIIDYFSGNCTSVNSGNWFHSFVFNCDTDLETILVNGGLNVLAPYRTKAMDEMHYSVSWSFARQFDASGTKARYYNKGYEVLVDNVTSNNIPSSLWSLNGKMSTLFNMYYGTQKPLGKITASELPGIYDGLAADIAAFDSLSNAAKIAAFGNDAFSFMNVVTQLKPIVGGTTSAAIEKYLPKHTYEKYNNVTYQVTVEKVTTVVSSIDNLLSDKRIGKILGSFKDTLKGALGGIELSGHPINIKDTSFDAETVHDILVNIIQDVLFSDAIINMIIELVYPMVDGLLSQYLTKDFLEPTISNAVGSAFDDIVLSALRTVTEMGSGGYAAFGYQILLQDARVALTPAGFAWLMYQSGYNTTYPTVFNELKHARGGDFTKGTKQSVHIDFKDQPGGPYYAIGGENDSYSDNRWKDVNFDNMVWNINGDRKAFQAALDCALLPLAKLLASVLGNQTLKIFAGDLAIDFSLVIKGLDLYDDVLLPLLETLGVGGLCTPTKFRSNSATVISNPSRANVETFYNEGLLTPLLDWVVDTLLANPISTILTLLPNLSHYLTTGALLATIKGIQIPLYLNLALGKWNWGDISLTTLKVVEMIGEEKIAFLDSLQGVLDLIGFKANTGIPIIGYKWDNESDHNVYKNYSDGMIPVTRAYKNSSGDMLDFYSTSGGYTIEVYGLDEDGTVNDNAIRDYVGWTNAKGDVWPEYAEGVTPTGYTQRIYKYYKWTEKHMEPDTANPGNEVEVTVTHYSVSKPSDDIDYDVVESIRYLMQPISLPALMDYKLQSCGTIRSVASLRESAIQSDGSTISGFGEKQRTCVVMEVGNGVKSEGLVLLFLFRYLLSALKYRVYTNGAFESDATLLDSFGLGDTLTNELMDGFSLGDVINNIALHPDEVIASLYELFYQHEDGSLWTLDDVKSVIKGKPYKYPLKYVNYYTDNIMDAARENGDYAYGTNILYTKYWTNENAVYVVDNLDDIVENVLAMLKMNNMESVSALLNGLLVDNVFNNNMLSNLVGMIYGMLDSIEFDLSTILGAALDVDYSKKALVTALEYEFGDIPGYKMTSIYEDVDRNDVYANLFRAAGSGSKDDKKYTAKSFYEKIGIDNETGEIVYGDALDWGFENPAITARYTPSQIFLKAASAALSPFAILIKFLFAGEDLNILDLIHIPGYEAYQYAWIPLMDTLMATRGLVSFKEYYTKLFAARPGISDDETLKVQQNVDAFEYLLLPIINFVEDVIADPVSVVLTMLPNLLFFLSIGGINDLVNNLVHFVYVLLDILQPVYDVYPLVNSLLSNLRLGEGIVLNLSLPLDIDVNQLVNTLIESLVSDALSFEIENKNYQTGIQKVEEEYYEPVLDDNGEEQYVDGELVVEKKTRIVDKPVYVTATLRITLPYLDLATLCAGTVVEKESISGERIVILNTSGGADLLTLILRLVVETLFYQDNAMNIADFLIDFCLLDDEVDNDDLLIEIFTYLNGRAHEEEFPDKTLWLLFQIYKLLVPIADNIGGRFKNVDFSITDIFNDIGNWQKYLSELLAAGGNSSPSLSAFQRLIQLIKAFFEKIRLFFANLFS